MEPSRDLSKKYSYIDRGAMYGMNKTILAVVSAIALVYSGLCFFLTLQGYITSNEHPVHFWVFLPLSMDSLGFDISQWIIDNVASLNFDGKAPLEYLIDTLFKSLPDSVTGLKFEIVLVLLLVGFILSIAGFMTKPAMDCAGVENPVQYLWTHRPHAFSRCLAMPWDLLVAAWSKSKALVIIPILLLPLYFCWSIMISIALIIPFILVRLVIGMKISGAAKRESSEYQKNTDYGVCPHCKRNFERPMVKCRCGLIINYPVPNEYGYKVHYCNKGHEISCESGKRANLTTICPHCQKQIQTREALPITISLVGGTGTGKTSLMLASVETLTHNARIVDVTVDSPSPGLSKEAISAKDYAPRTVPGETESQILFLRSLKLQDREIVFNDISGVEFQPSVDKMLFEEYYNYTNGIIFTFDPLAFNREYLREAPHEVFDCFHYMYTTIRGIGPGSVSDVPFAVVATKNDLMNPKLNDDDVRQYLIDNGEENFVMVVESVFSEVKYFAVSSHGTNCASSLKPVWWIVGHVDKKLTELIPVA